MTSTQNFTGTTRRGAAVTVNPGPAGGWFVLVNRCVIDIFETVEQANTVARQFAD